MLEVNGLKKTYIGKARTVEAIRDWRLGYERASGKLAGKSRTAEAS